jgi:hypothetical protein
MSNCAVGDSRKVFPAGLQVRAGHRDEDPDEKTYSFTFARDDDCAV